MHPLEPRARCGPACLPATDVSTRPVVAPPSRPLLWHLQGSRMLPRRSYHLKKLPMVALVNAGSIRKSIPAGPITAQAVLEAVPFPNWCATM